MIAKGIRGPHFKGRSVQRTPQGKNISVTWEGTELEIAGLEPAVARVYHNVDIQRIGNSPVWQLVATKFVGPNGKEVDVFHSFELLHNTIQQSTDNSLVLYRKFGGDALFAENIIFIEELRLKMNNTARLEDDDPNKFTYRDAVDRINAKFSGVQAGRAHDLLDDKIAKVLSFYEFEYAFRWSTRYNFSNPIVINYGNEGRYYETTAEMLEGEGAPTKLIKFNLPEREWLVIPPSVNNNHGGVTEVVRDYWAADVHSRLYYLSIGEILPGP